MCSSSGRGGSCSSAPYDSPRTIDSKLPRYYYSVYDHYLSPTWSPDGKELILVSNRGKIWGSGGLWRMEARPGAPMTLVHDEESTWRMRPDWSLDGKRVVYASYLGRQWHQLWLTTGGLAAIRSRSPLATSTPPTRAGRPTGGESPISAIRVATPRSRFWGSPGGSAPESRSGVGYTANPVGRLRITVLDGATGKAIPARISVTLPDGRSAGPDDAWRHSDDGFDRKERKFEIGYFHTAGSSTLTVPAGVISLEVTHGLDYRVFRENVQISANQLTVRTVRLARLAALPGWTSGDLHVHMNYGGHYRATPTTLALQARAEGLNLVENLIVNKEDRVPDIGYFTGRPDPISTADLLILHDQEFHTSWWGHTSALGLTDHVLLPDYAGYAGTPVQSLFPDNATVADLTHRQGGLFGYVHPFDTDPDPADTTTPLTNGLPIDVALGKVDYIEIVAFSDHLATSKVWYRLLNCGFRLPASAGTDAMSNFASLRGPVGTDRVYVESGLPLDRSRWYAALKAGKSMATNGPLLRFSLREVGVGGQISVPAGPNRMTAKVTMSSIVPIDHLELIGNGAVVATIPLHGDRTSADTAVVLDVKHSGWYLLRAYSDRAIEPVLDIYPFGTTSPVYVTVGGKPPRGGADAEYFLEVADRLAAAAEAHQGWNTSQEKREVLARIQEARAEFAKRR